MSGFYDDEPSGGGAEQRESADELHDNNNKHDADLTPERHDSRMEDSPGDAANDVDHANATSLPLLDTSMAHRTSKPHHPPVTPLYIQTQYTSSPYVKETPTVFESSVPINAGLLQSPAAIMPAMGSSLRSNHSTSSMTSISSSVSAAPSPYLAAMTDITPLPSPLTRSESGGSLWRRSLERPQTPGRISLDRAEVVARTRGTSGSEGTPTNVYMPSAQGPTSASSPPKRKKGYGSLLHEAVETSWATASATEDNDPKDKKSHGRNRSISDFVPSQLQNVQQRHVTYGPGDVASLEAQEYHMQREQNLAAQRGLTVPADPKAQQQQLPSPPPSTSSNAESDAADEAPYFLEDGTAAEYLEIHCGLKNKRRKFRQLRQLGEGTFSKVVLATRERIPSHPTPDIEDHLDPHKLVAVKIVERGPAGGADEQRIDTGLKREIEMLNSVSHPSLVHLKACEHQERRSLLVLTYCPGGDLFEFASQKRDHLTAPMVQRIFSELVNAVQYLHTNWIVHRDIKLENVLVNISHTALASISDPLTYPAPLVTLTDLGLSRRIPQPPESPLLQTRCGSEDYAAPEILLGQPYDGRQTDAWALGVLLYALMEGRLPFDAPPGKPDRSRNTHRIARCDWIWCRFGDRDGDWDTEKKGTVEWEGARWCVEGLLKKVRIGRVGLAEVEARDWVKTGVQVEGGLQVRGEDDEKMV